MEVEKMRKYAILALGVAVCLTGAVLMAFGKGLLGENLSGIATIIGIVGIGIITSSKRSSAETNHQLEVC
jgi:hypothetical protein